MINCKPKKTTENGLNSKLCNNPRVVFEYKNQIREHFTLGNDFVWVFQCKILLPRYFVKLNNIPSGVLKHHTNVRTVIRRVKIDN